MAAIEKKKKAAIAAVMQYLAAEEREMPVEAPAHESEAAVPPEAAIPNRSMLPGATPWGMSGRNAQMQMRQLMQFRSFRNPTT